MKSAGVSASLIDFHTHILPRMDDGSLSVEMSQKMLDMSRGQGVGCVVLTPHFYPSRDYPEHFLKKREHRFGELLAARGNSRPTIIPGAEVQYFDGLTEMRDLPRLRIGKSPALLVEMPFCEWTNRVVENIIELSRRGEYVIIIAHIERYMQFQSESVIRRLVREGVLIQSNADFFTRRLSSRKALNMLDDGLIHLIGSDCHNITSRPPNISGAFELISKKRGPEAVQRIIKRGTKLLLTEAKSEVKAEAQFVELHI